MRVEEDDATKCAMPATDDVPAIVSAIPDSMLDFDMLCIPFVDSACMVRFRVNEIRFGTGVRNLRFTLEDQLTGEKRDVYPRGRRTGGSKVEFTANFPVYNVPGPYTWYVTVECRNDRRKFEGEFVLFVNRLEDARKVATQVAVNINNNIHNGNASDVNLNINAAEALDRILKSPEDPYEALRRLVYGKERAWSEVELFELPPECVPTPNPVPAPRPPSLSHPRLTLKCGEEVIQLLSDDCVTFGRNETTTIPLRICGADGKVDLAANKADEDYIVSRRHFQIGRIGANCVLSDGVDGKASYNGTGIDGTLLPPSGEVQIEVGRSHEIVAGYRCGDNALKMRVTFHRDKCGCPAGFVLERLDGARQMVYTVWKEVPLCDGYVSWDGSCWYFRDGAGKSIPLIVGISAHIGGKTYEISPFLKTHLK